MNSIAMTLTAWSEFFNKYQPNINYNIYMKDTKVYIPFNQYSKMNYYTPTLNRTDPLTGITRSIVKILSRIP